MKREGKRTTRGGNNEHKVAAAGGADSLPEF